jgi:beta-lactamase class A
MNKLGKKLQKKLEELANDYAGVMGIGAQALKEKTKAFLVNPDEIFCIGSSIKIPILIEFFKKVEQEKLSTNTPFTYKEKHNVGGSGVIQFLTPDELTMPLIDYATLMINVSDNVATNIMIDLVTMKDVNNTLNELGLTKTLLQRKMIDWKAAREGKENISTPREQIQLMECLYHRKGLSEYVCSETIKILKKQKRGTIKEGVPVSIEVADKSGGVEGVSCDIGIVYQPQCNYSVAIMTKHIPLSDTGNLATSNHMRHVSKTIYEYFQELSYSTDYGRRFS